MSSVLICTQHGAHIGCHLDTVTVFGIVYLTMMFAALLVVIVNNTRSRS